MTYALVRNATIEQVGALPRLWPDTDGRWWDFRNPLPAGVALADLGWYEVTDVARPADTATTTFDRSVALQDGTPTVTWTERQKTPAEVQAADAQANRGSIRDKALAALSDNADFLGLASPTSAEAVAQVRRLTRECNGLIRLVLGQLDTDDS